MRLTRYRLRALVRPARRALIGATLAALTFVVVRGAIARTEAAQRAWGERRTVLVAAHDLRPGDRVDAAVRRQERPAALVAADALDPGDAIDDVVVALPVLEGEPVRRAHLTTAGRLAAGQRAFALPRPAGLPLAAGQRLDVLDATEGLVVAGAATVLADAGDDVVLVAVDAAEAGAVARAVAANRVVLALAG